MFRPEIAKFAAMMALVAILAACQSAEERAESHYQSALELLEEGDPVRALVELRNVFNLNNTHREARILYANTQLEQGDLRDAYGQFLRLVEQYPEDVEALTKLSRISIDQQNWPDVIRYGTTLRELVPENVDAQAIGIIIDYTTAIEAEDVPARREAARTAVQMVESSSPEDTQLRRVIIDNAQRDGEAEIALAQVDAILEREPADFPMLANKARLLAGLDRTDELEAHFRTTLELFPEDDNVLSALLRLFVIQDRLDEAEAFMRERRDASGPETRVQATTELIGLILQIEGEEAAMAELDLSISAAPDATALRSMRARMEFDYGDREAAIAEMEELLDGAGDDPADSENRIVLAQMLEVTGNRVGAQRMIARVLEADATAVAALRMEAGWLIERDEIDEAVSLLRTALNEAPEDLAAMQLMADAHMRNGNRALARDLLSLAVQASQSGLPQSRRYAAVLLEDERFLLAEEILVNALRANGPQGRVELLQDLGQVYLAMEDWSRAEQVEDNLRDIGDPAALRAADGLNASRLGSQFSMSEAIDFLEGLADQNQSDVAVQVAIIRARLMDGDSEGALDRAAAALTGDPGNIGLRLLNATTLMATGDLTQAEAGFRSILDENDQVQGAWLSLLRILTAQGESRAAERDAVMDAALEAMPDAPDLLWSKASILEREGDRVGALAVYETIYSQIPNSLVAANNLASLLSTNDDADAEALERASVVARRLRGSDVPAFQDTFGWIQYRRGDLELALEYLEPAAQGLPNDALVQYHLGATLDDLGRRQDALEVFKRALEVAGDDPRLQFEDARERIAAIEALSAEPQDDSTVER